MSVTDYHKVVFHNGTKQVPGTVNDRGGRPIQTMNTLPIEIPYEVGRTKEINVKKQDGTHQKMEVLITRITYERVDGGDYAYRIHVVSGDLPEVILVDLPSKPFKAVHDVGSVWGLEFIEI